MLVLAGIAGWLTTRTWADGWELGVSLSWNGFGQPANTDAAAPLPSLQGLGAAPLGIWIAIACAVAVAAALALVLGPRAAGAARALCATAAAVTLAGAAIPIAVIARPAVFLASPFAELGVLSLLTNPHYAEPVAGLLARGTLLTLAGVLVALAGVCLAGAFGARRRPAPAGFPAEPGAG